MRRRLLFALLVPLLAVAPAACSDDEDPLADLGGTGGGDDVTAVDDAPSDPLDDGSVELLDPGVEPRIALRLDPPEDCAQAVTMTQEQEQGVEVGGEEQASTTASTEFDIVYRCTEITDDEIAVTTEYVAARLVDAGPEVAAAMEDVLDAFTGTAGAVRFSRRGAVLDLEAPDVELDGASGATLDSLTDGLSGAATPFPEEPVGVGARWRHVVEVDSVGMAMRQITEYTITSIEGDRVVADTAVSMEVLPGSLDSEALGMGDAEAEVLGGGFSGSGTQTWDLGAVAPYSDQTLDGTTEMVVRAGGEEQRLVQRQRQHVTIAPTVD